MGSQSAGCQKQPFFASPRWSRPPVVVRNEQKLKPAIGLTALPSQQTTRKMQNAHALARHMCDFLTASTRRSRSVVRADSICLSSDNQNCLDRWPRPRMPTHIRRTPPSTSATAFAIYDHVRLRPTPPFQRLPSLPASSAPTPLPSEMVRLITR